MQKVEQADPAKTAAQAAQPAPPIDTPDATPPIADAGDNAQIDVGAILDKAAKESGQTLNWRTSIVDLMKALEIDSSLSSRKALAAELSYEGNTDDSAAMNIWLHKQVLTKLAANGGTVPADLLD